MKVRELNHADPCDWPPWLSRPEIMDETLLHINAVASLRVNACETAPMPSRLHMCSHVCKITVIFFPVSNPPEHTFPDIFISG